MQQIKVLQRALRVRLDARRCKVAVTAFQIAPSLAIATLHCATYTVEDFSARLQRLCRRSILLDTFEICPATAQAEL
ncbi:hypothetical protein GGE07_000410 [Sinorhizobium terangae]|nr:hypothetical protein [Sinorhizobium terangae]